MAIKKRLKRVGKADQHSFLINQTLVFKEPVLKQLVLKELVLKKPCMK